MIIAVTEMNNVYALDALDGNVIWERNVARQCPQGISATPNLIQWASPAHRLSILPHGHSF